MKKTIQQFAAQPECDPTCQKAIRRDFKLRLAISVFSAALGVVGVLSHVA
jgi:hypothetical protein